MRTTVTYHVYCGGRWLSEEGTWIEGLGFSAGYLSEDSAINAAQLAPKTGGKIYILALLPDH